MSSKAKRARRLQEKATRRGETDTYYALDQKIAFTPREFEPLTLAQEGVFRNFSRKHMFLYGYAGTGKTFLALYLALKELFSPHTPYKKIVIIRSLVQTREMGHMPGNDKEKMKYYEAPYMPICGQIFGRADAYAVLKQKGFIEFISTSFIRGITLDDCIVIVDEIQNCNEHECNSLITRVGNNCKIVFCGDLRQNDLNKRKEFSGLADFMKIIREMNQFDFIEFHEEDIVRSDLVKNYIITKTRLEDSGVIRANL